MKIKISAGFSGVIATGNYQNARPAYGADIEIELPEDSTPEQIKERIKEEQKRLQSICYGNFKQDEQTQIRERVNREREDIRWYGDYPSVTSIINWDSDFFMSNEQLQQYASQGTLTHKRVEHYIGTGEWIPAKDIEGTWADLVILKKGDLNLKADVGDFPAFLEKYPLKGMENGQIKLSHKHRYGGTPDIRVCYHKGKKTLADVKRTANKVNFKQIAAYILAEEENEEGNGEKPYEQMMIIPLNDKTKRGFSQPLVSDKIKQYQSLFLKDRETFLRRFGV